MKSGKGVKFVRLLRIIEINETIPWSCGIFWNIHYLSYVMLIIMEYTIDVSQDRWAKNKPIFKLKREDEHSLNNYKI